RTLRQRCPDRPVRTLGSRRRCNALEVLAPLEPDARGITQILLVERVQELGVAAVRGCGFEHAKVKTGERSILTECGAGRNVLRSTVRSVRAKEAVRCAAAVPRM